MFDHLCEALAITFALFIPVWLLAPYLPDIFHYRFWIYKKRRDDE